MRNIVVAMLAFCLLTFAGERARAEYTVVEVNFILADKDGNFLLSKPEYLLVDHVFLSAFSRHPADSERESILQKMRTARVETGPDEAKLTARREVLEDLMWALLTKKEFLFNH